MCVVETITLGNSACVCDILKIQLTKQLVQTKLYCVSAGPCSSDPMINTNWCTMNQFWSRQVELWLLHGLFQLLGLVCNSFLFLWASHANFMEWVIYCSIQPHNSLGHFNVPCNWLGPLVHICCHSPSLSHTLSNNGQNYEKFQNPYSTFKSCLFFILSWVCMLSWWLLVVGCLVVGCWSVGIQCVYYSIL